MSQLMKISILGAFPGGEVWSVNPVYRLGTGLDVPVTDANMTAIVTAINAITVPTAILTTMGTASSIVGVRAEARMATGELQNIAEAGRAVPVPGQGSSTHPFQTSIVTSLRSSASGARGRGRLYWPATGLALVAGTMRPATSGVTSILTGVKTYLSGIETAIEASVGGASLAVWSRLNASLSAVNLIQCGDVLDVQRRRRDSLIEGVSATPYP